MIRIFVFILTICLVSIPASAQKKGKNKKGKKDKGNTTAILSASDQQLIENIFLEGVQAQILEKYDVAKEKYLDCLNIDPNNAAVNYELALLYENENSFAEAAIYAQKAAQANPNNKWYQYLYADFLIKQHNYDEAITVYQNLIEKQPDNIDAYSELSRLYKMKGETQKAIDALDALESKMGVIEPISIDKQRLYLQLNQTEKAGQEIEKLIEANPSNTGYYNLLAEMYMANGKEDLAFDVYERLIKVAPNDPAAKIALAQKERAKGNNAKADQLLLEAFKQPKLEADYKVNFLMNMVNSSLAAEKGVPPIVEDLGYAIAETHPKSAAGYAVLGDIFIRQNNKEKALENYLKTVEVDPNLYTVWEQIFFLQSDLNKMEDLAKTSKQVIELYPNQAISYYFNGLANNRLENHEKAIKSLKRAAIIDAKNENLLSEVYTLLGDSYNSTKKFEKSDESFDKALEINPNNAFVLNNYAYYLSLRKELLAKAAEMSKKSNEIFPNNASFEDTYAWILYEMEDYDNAKIWIEKSLKNGGNERPVIVEHYGDILFKLGLPNQAVGQWQNALKLGGDAKTLQPKIDKKGL